MTIAVPVSSPRALRELRNLFRQLTDSMQEMHGACQIRPADASAVILPADDGEGHVVIQCRPVVCSVPERASHANASLFVVFEGRIVIGADVVSGELATISYATNFAYFVHRSDMVSHVLGGHYDYVVGHSAHPRAHLQLASKAELHDSAIERFPSIRDVPLDNELMPRIFSRARTPTAQMDFLSFMVQICADHLVDEKSPPAVTDAFAAVTSSCSPFKGYNTAEPLGNCDCQRAPHWYP